MIQRLSIAILLLVSVATVAQTRSFTVEEAVTFALDSNYTAINSRRDIAKAIKRKWETTASGLPQVSASLDYNYQIKQPTQLIPAEFVGGDAGTFIPVVFGTQQNATATATLSQLIFDGSYLVGLQAAKTFLDYSKNANEKTQLEVRKGVINAYGGVLLAQESVAILDKNIATLEDNLRETRIIFENGFAEEEDVEQLQITFLSLKNQRANAQRMVTIAKQMFNLAIGIDVNEETVLTQTLEGLALPALGLLNDTVNLEQNVDYKIVNNLNEQRELELKLEKSKALPTLGAFINVGTFAGRNEFNFFDSDEKWFPQSITGFQLNIPIFSSGMRNARTAQAAIALDQAKTQKEETAQQIKLAYASAKSDHELAIDNYNTSLKNITLAERIENKNQIKFREGLSTSFDLRQAQTQLYQVQQELLQAMLQIITTKADLETILNVPNYTNN
ncbi:TolC family protein [uncultured Dokdonia sp.]|jgi:outer membrane protein|uniref:TolC family protein n=1 Tax=Dokdonia sp. R78006 TaxID=3093866 RepID=UPI0026297E76|nr:TolC family protein [uncultured Dokdonia sp.]|tara:strand:+ start:314651 stop:315991 length:1341 start_codon:yes stop_codon:yes gene_type:complete